MKIVKWVIEAISKPLTYICNLSFQTGKFPNKMKIAKVVPLYKTGDRHHFTNYRPVSLLPQFSKILEKIFINRLNKFIDKHKLLSDSQYEFRSQSSTALALMESIRYGIRGTVLHWMESYLTDRRQFVKLGGCSSSCLDIVCGVPQGSVLGPKLFILYINDICKVSKVLKLVLFADDTNIFCSGGDLQKLLGMITAEMCNLKKWFDRNKLSLNLNKTKFMLFGNYKTNVQAPIKVDEVDIMRVHEVKFLGAIVDEKISWKPHIKHVQSKLSRSISVLSKAKHFLDHLGQYL